MENTVRFLVHSGSPRPQGARDDNTLCHCEKGAESDRRGNPSVLKGEVEDAVRRIRNIISLLFSRPFFYLLVN